MVEVVFRPWLNSQKRLHGGHADGGKQQDQSKYFTEKSRHGDFPPRLSLRHTDSLVFQKSGRPARIDTSFLVISCAAYCKYESGKREWRSTEVSLFGFSQ
jgi:hypothetical protein